MRQRLYEFVNSPTGLLVKPEVFAQGKGLDGPHGVAFDPEGNLYVTNWGGGTGGDALEYPATNGVLSSSAAPFVSGFSGPTYIMAYIAR